MSVHAYAWAWQQDLDPEDKYVLLAMCEYADATGLCWPAHSTLAKMTGRHRITILRTLQRLERNGIIARHSDKQSSRRKSSTYRILLEGPRLPRERGNGAVDESVDDANRRAFPEMATCSDVQHVDKWVESDLPVAQSYTSDDALRYTTCSASATPPVAPSATRIVKNRNEPSRLSSVDNSDPDAWHKITDAQRESALAHLAEIRGQLAHRTPAKPSAATLVDVEGVGVVDTATGEVVAAIDAHAVELGSALRPVTFANEIDG